MAEPQPSQSASDPAAVEDAIRDELRQLGVTVGIDVMARRIRRRLEAEGRLA